MQLARAGFASFRPKRRSKNGASHKLLESRRLCTATCGYCTKDTLAEKLPNAQWLVARLRRHHIDYLRVSGLGDADLCARNPSTSGTTHLQDQNPPLRRLYGRLGERRR